MKDHAKHDLKMKNSMGIQTSDNNKSKNVCKILIFCIGKFLTALNDVRYLNYSRSP